MRYSIDGQILTDIADAINAKTGGTTALAPGDMAEAIGDISGGGDSRIVEIDGSGGEVVTLPTGVVIEDMFDRGVVSCYVTITAMGSNAYFDYNGEYADDDYDYYAFGNSSNSCRFAYTGSRTVRLAYLKFNGQDMSSYIPTVTWTITVIDTRA